ncbi:HET-domain-containing protein, partial [Acephala macrosclerotiorum]
MRQAFLPQAQPRSSKQYRYRPFETKNSIRLFQLKPGNREEPIEGRLICVSFDSKPKYEALSYAWGNSAMHHHILTDEGTIPMTASVRSALTRLRLPNRERVLWIDALCINQRDNDEKSEQILLMPKIYSSASMVVVHLGQESDRSDLTIKLIEKIAKTSFYTAMIWKHFRTFWTRPWFRRIWVVQEFVLAK